MERKVAVITGASRGIGAQLSEAYRQIGYQVIAKRGDSVRFHSPE